MRIGVITYAIATLVVPAVIVQMRVQEVAAAKLRRPSLEESLATRIGSFDSSGKPMTELVIDLAYAYKLPMAVEYVNRAAATHPIRLRLHSQRLGEILETIVDQVPGFKISFAEGLVQIYSPESRADPANLLNKKIQNFQVNEADTEQASADLSCALGRALNPRVACFSSIAPGQWGPLKITIHIRNSTVYEILNAVVAQNGRAIWTVLAPPKGLSVPGRNLWYIYPLDPAFKQIVIDRLENFFPTKSKSG